MPPAKRLLDVVLALTMLAMGLPLILLICVAIRLDSPGPVFCVQEPVGYRGVRFRMFKFRSMVTRAVTSVRGAY